MRLRAALRDIGKGLYSLLAPGELEDYKRRKNSRRQKGPSGIPKLERAALKHQARSAAFWEKIGARNLDRAF